MSIERIQEDLHATTLPPSSHSNTWWAIPPNTVLLHTLCSVLFTTIHWSFSTPQFSAPPPLPPLCCSHFLYFLLFHPVLTSFTNFHLILGAVNVESKTLPDDQSFPILMLLSSFFSSYKCCQSHPAKCFETPDRQIWNKKKDRTAQPHCNVLITDWLSGAQKSISGRISQLA